MNSTEKLSFFNGNRNTSFSNEIDDSIVLVKDENDYPAANK